MSEKLFIRGLKTASVGGIPKFQTHSHGLWQYGHFLNPTNDSPIVSLVIRIFIDLQYISFYVINVCFVCFFWVCFFKHGSSRPWLPRWSFLCTIGGPRPWPQLHVQPLRSAVLFLVPCGMGYWLQPIRPTGAWTNIGSGSSLVNSVDQKIYWTWKWMGLAWET